MGRSEVEREVSRRPQRQKLILILVLEVGTVRAT
jgi:hypothetical protein